MPLKNKHACLVIDCPVNALMAAMIGRQWKSLDIIYAIDTDRKNLSDYKNTYALVLGGLNIAKETVIHYDSALFWGGKKNSMLPAIQKELKPLLDSHGPDYVYFGNCLTNPVALGLKRYVTLNHLYHSPSDFSNIFYATKPSVKSRAKELVKKILGISLSKIEVNKNPIYSPLDFASAPEFQFVDYREFSSSAVETMLASMTGKVREQTDRIMLLLAGSEPEPGDNNPSDIIQYITAHVAAVRQLMKACNLDSANIWLKEHKSYIPLTSDEREALCVAFAEISCSTFFVADYLPRDYGLLPGECVLKYCQFDHIIAEPSSFLLNVSGSINAIAAVTAFAPYRDQDQIARNNQFLDINRLLANPCHVY